MKREATSFFRHIGFRNGGIPPLLDYMVAKITGKVAEETGPRSTVTGSYIADPATDNGLKDLPGPSITKVPAEDTL